MEFDHFLKAQGAVYEQVLRELSAGRKTSHWMWFIFPQLRGLGHSAMAELYAIESLAQARRYLAHKVLGPRLRECTELVNQATAVDAEQIFGKIDTMKLRSSMTLFARAAGESAPDDSVFARALGKYFGGKMDQRTLDLLGRE